MVGYNAVPTAIATTLTFENAFSHSTTHVPNSSVNPPPNLSRRTPNWGTAVWITSRVSWDATPRRSCRGPGSKNRGGRRGLIQSRPTLEANLRQLLQEFTAGDPMRVGVLWTNLSLRELQRRLIDLGTPASRRVIRRLLRQLKIGRRTARKKKTMGHHSDRNAQFENIARLRREFQDAGQPIISIDTKKKTLLFARP